jgi:hypothetical protein
MARIIDTMGYTYHVRDLGILPDTCKKLKFTGKWRTNNKNTDVEFELSYIKKEWVKNDGTFWRNFWCRGEYKKIKIKAWYSYFDFTIEKNIEYNVNNC